MKSTSNIDDDNYRENCVLTADHDALLPDGRQQPGPVSYSFDDSEQKAMKCSDLQSNLSIYADGFLGEAESAAAGAHLDVCPVCRQTDGDIREIRTGLRQLRRVQIPTELGNKIKRSLITERRAEKSSWLRVSPEFSEWLRTSVLPYGVGAVASILIGLTFLTMMFSVNGDSRVMLASNSNPFRETDSAEISPSDYAQTRLGFANESPSINPQGALIALTRSLVRGSMRDDEVVVVADVFGNGLARITEVVEPSRDRRAVGELQKALESDPAYAAFVPAKMENRPDSVRVVLKFQSVNVRTGDKPGRRRR